MGLDFDAVEYCKNVKLKQSNPPYACPVSKCDRSYKTVVGLQYHLLNYDHDNPQPTTPVMTPSRKKARSRAHSTPKSMKDPQQSQSQHKSNQVNPETLVTYNQDEQMVTFNIESKSVRIAADKPLPIITDEEFADLMEKGLILKTEELPDNAFATNVKVPVAKFRKIDDYNITDAPPRPLAYYRFIEKSAEELDGEVEYDVDEEDTIWLSIINERREEAGLNPVSIDTLELLIDRLEKESYFQAAANGTSTGVEVDDDAVCCICMDGECQNTNVILFCDMCNLAVHQDCYGVPYIPEGQWLCRRCLQSPSTPVHCVLCPNTGGAFKQTDRGQWAHVVCALWIPEVRFANTVFLEPIDSIETIPQARWRLTCYVCREKGVGACIQCHRNSCYAAFHVTCAQQAGLYMTMDTIEGHNDSSVHVQKYAYCHAHTPADAKLKASDKVVEDTRQKMREARKALAKKRLSAPVVLIPTIPPDRMQEISTLVTMQKKSQFLERLTAYWMLKRQYRNGVPLLRRLQSQGNHHAPLASRNGIDNSADTTELYQQLKYWQCLRQDLERARLLCELVRKREKLKAQYVKICEQVVMLQLNPLESAMSKLLDALEAKDTAEIFREPVDTEEVPDYLDIVKHPMDLSTMREKLKRAEYSTLEQLETDFDLMIQNCLAYNNKDTMFYRAGIRMRDQAVLLFKQLREELKREGLVEHSALAQQDHVELEVENELKQLLAAPVCEDTVQKMLILADKSQVLKNPTYRTKKIKQIRVEITRMRKAIQKSKAEARNSSMNNISQSDDDEEDGDVNVTVKEQDSVKRKISHAAKKPHREEEDDAMSTCGVEDESKEDSAVQTPPCSPIKHLNNSASPAGVNRRTAVLFTRKAQAALKRPSEQSVKEESSSASSAAAAVASLASTSSSNSSSATLGSSKLAAHLSPLASGGGLTALNVGPSTSAAAAKSPKRAARHKRISDMRSSASTSPKKSPHVSLAASTSAAAAAAAAAAGAAASAADSLTYNSIPDSFRVYRANTMRDASESDDDDVSDISGSPCSSCSGFSVSGSGSEYDDSSDEAANNENEEEDEDEAENDDDDDDEGTNAARNAENESEDVEMRDITTGASGNGETPMSGCESAPDEEEDANTNTASTGRTSTPSADKTQRRTSAKSKALRSTPIARSATPRNSTKASARLASKHSGTGATATVNNLKMKNNMASSSSSTANNRSHRSRAAATAEATSLAKPPLEPLQLVWAKCRGYPWYPALILDPKTPKGFVYNGVPLPAPPQDVLALRKNCPEDVFLVLFFDAKRTWQWLPENKLEILGIDKELDQSKLVESRKPTERKAVKKAYQDALHYQSQVSDLEGQGPDPIM